MQLRGPFEHFTNYMHLLGRENVRPWQRIMYILVLCDNSIFVTKRKVYEPNKVLNPISQIKRVYIPTKQK